MKHSATFSPQEKVKIWLDLCDFTFRLMDSSLDDHQLEKRLRRMRDEDIRGHNEFLTRLGELNQ